MWVFDLPRRWLRSIFLSNPAKSTAWREGDAPRSEIEPLEERNLLAGTGLAGAYFARTNHTLAKFSRVDATLNLHWASGTPSASLGTDGFSVRWTGWIQANFTETYNISAKTSGGLRLWVLDSELIDDMSSHTLTEDSGTIALVAGKKYPIRIDYWSNGTNTPSIELDWQSAHQAKGIVPQGRLYPAILDKVAPSAPPALHLMSATDKTVDVGWKPSSDPSRVIAYEVYVGSARVGITSPGQMDYMRSGLAANTGYTFSVQAIDAAGNLSAKSTVGVTTTAVTNHAPTTPGNVHVTGTTNTTISLAWNASTDDHGISGYRVYRDGAKIGAPKTASYNDNGLAADTTHTYMIKAVDSDGVSSGASASVQGHTTPIPDAIPHDAYSGINGSEFDQFSGVSTSGNDLTSLDDGDFVVYKNVDFGDGANSVTLNLALPTSNIGGRIDVTLDGLGGPILAEYTPQPTGSFDTYIQQRFNLEQTAIGVHDLYVEFNNRQGVANLRSITFSTQHLTQIMPLGDSITQGFGASPNYRYYLWQKLQQAGKVVDFVGTQMQGWQGGPPNLDFDQNNEGHVGMRADEVAAGAAGWASQNFPDIVLLHIGTNDVIAGQSTSSTLDDISAIIDGLRIVNPNVKILLAQIIPTIGFDAAVNDLNSQIPGLAASKSTGQSPVIVVDQNTGFDENNDLVDGIHPNSTGDSKMADRWYDALIQLLQ